MNRKYSEGTSVSSFASREEIERNLRRFGADQYLYYARDSYAGIGFSLSGRQYRLGIDLPDPNDKRFTHTSARGTRRTAKAAEEEYEKEVRRKWRSLALYIKAVLVAVDDGILPIDQALFPFTVLPSGSTVYQTLVPSIDEAYETGVFTVPMLLSSPEDLPDHKLLEGTDEV